MSKYTTELRYVCETLAGKTESTGYDDVNNVINAALPSLFNFDYPIYDENYRRVLEKKIVMHYYCREICAETVGLWKLYLQAKMNEIMPYYNELYRTTLIDFNPLYDVNLTREHTKTGTEAGTGANTTNNSYTMARETENSGENAQTGTTSRAGTVDTDEDLSNTSQGTTGTQNTRNIDEDHQDAYSDTPNNKITGVTDMDYLTNFRHVVNDNSVVDNGSSTENSTSHDVNSRSVEENSTDTVDLTTTISDSGSVDETGSSNGRTDYTNSLNTTENYIETVIGSSGGQNYSKRIADFRKNILNIDMQIINELNSLFFGLW